jgi:hypothetical protein
MTYTPLCNLPNFQQGVPSAGTWKCAGSFNGGLRWDDLETRKTVLVPHIWYNSPGSSYAETLRWNAARSEENARRKLQEDVPESLRKLEPWDRIGAEDMRRQARRLLAMAMLCDRFPDMPASHIDFRGLHDPTTPRDVEAATVEAIERGE